MELAGNHVGFELERAVPVAHKGRPLAAKFRIDLLVESSLIVELKAVEAVRPVHKAQVITYLKLTGHQVGLLFNFNEATLKSGLHRLEHPDRYARRLRPVDHD